MVVGSVVRGRNVGVLWGVGWGLKAREVILGRCARVTVATNGFHVPVVLVQSVLPLHTTPSTTRRGRPRNISQHERNKDGS